MCGFVIVVVQREYEEFKVKINGLVATAQKVPEDGWTMQDGTPWPGNNVRDHPGMIQVQFYAICFVLFYQLGYFCFKTTYLFFFCKNLITGFPWS